jgi:thymidylate synthase (FAD)
MEVELIAHTPNPEETIEKAARICYDSKVGTQERREKFLRGLVKSGHTATIEHVSATFMIKGVSRALTHELVRHRLMSFCQRSQRYCNEDGFQLVVPPSIKNNDELYGEWTKLMDRISTLYRTMIDERHNIPKEDARYILPNACFTQICVTANFREWRHFLELRLDKRAQWEIRNLAHIILVKLNELAPSIFGDLSETYLDGPF